MGFRKDDQDLLLGQAFPLWIREGHVGAKDDLVVFDGNHKGQMGGDGALMLADERGEIEALHECDGLLGIVLGEVGRDIHGVEFGSELRTRRTSSGFLWPFLPDTFQHSFSFSAS